MEDVVKGSKDLDKDEHYNTGLVGEAIILSSYKGITVDKLIKLQFILSKIIKRKKEEKYGKKNKKALR